MFHYDMNYVSELFSGASGDPEGSFPEFGSNIKFGYDAVNGYYCEVNVPVGGTVYLSCRELIRNRNIYAIDVDIDYEVISGSVDVSSQVFKIDPSLSNYPQRGLVAHTIQSQTAPGVKTIYGRFGDVSKTDETKETLPFTDDSIYTRASVGLFGKASSVIRIYNVRVKDALSGKLVATPPSADVAVHEISLTATYDATSQKSMYSRGDLGAPIVVSCHSWNGTYNNYDFYEKTLESCKSRGWAFISPNFRGSASDASTKYHAGHECCVSDVIDSLNYAIRQGGDASSVFIVGGSGGGYMATYMACLHPDKFKAVGSSVGIMDLGLWHEFCSTQYAKTPANNLIVYSNSLEVVFSNLPNVDYKTRSVLGNLDGLSIPICIAHGGFDTTVQIENAIHAWNSICNARGLQGLSPKEMSDLFYQSRFGYSVMEKEDLEFDHDIILRKQHQDCELYIEDCYHTGDVAIHFDFFDRKL